MSREKVCVEIIKNRIKKGGIGMDQSARANQWRIGRENRLASASMHWLQKIDRQGKVIKIKKKLTSGEKLMREGKEEYNKERGNKDSMETQDKGT